MTVTKRKIIHLDVVFSRLFLTSLYRTISSAFDFISFVHALLFVLHNVQEVVLAIFWLYGSTVDMIKALKLLHA